MGSINWKSHIEQKNKQWELHSYEALTHYSSSRTCVSHVSNTNTSGHMPDMYQTRGKN